LLPAVGEAGAAAALAGANGMALGFYIPRNWRFDTNKFI